MKIAGYELHPLAARLPMMEAADLEQLTADIKKNGLLDPIVIYAGKVLDGRHRLLACEQAGVKPRFEDWGTLTAHTETTPLEFVISKNFHRRQLTQSQKAIVAQELLRELQAEAADRKRATLKRGEARPDSAPVREREEQGKAAEQAAKAAGVSARTMEQAKFVAESSPELAEKVRSGEISLKKAEQTIRRGAQVAAAKVYVPPTGEYSVIFTDHPWQYDDQLNGSDNVRGGTPYPTMTLDEICAMRIPAAKDCVLFLCITHQHFLAAAHIPVLKAYGFRYRNWFTWKKTRMGVGHLLRNITEHVIIATKGNPTLVPLTDETTWFEAPAGEHSEKPDELFALIERMAPAPASARLEMFSRRTSRPGWTITGSELGKLDGAALGTATASECYVCRNPAGLGDSGLTYDALGTAHNVCLNALSAEAKADRRRRLSAAEKAESEELNGVAAAEFERECKVRGFTATAGEANWLNARCNSCSEVIEVGVFHDGALDPAHVDEIREHTCAVNCYVCMKPLSEGGPVQMGLAGSAHEACLDRAAGRKALEQNAQAPLVGWKYSVARKPRAHAYALTDESVSLCGAVLGNGRILKQGEKTPDEKICRACVEKAQPDLAQMLPPETIGSPTCAAVSSGGLHCQRAPHGPDTQHEAGTGPGRSTRWNDPPLEAAVVNAVACPRKGGCGEPAGKVCRSGSGNSRSPHAVRVAASQKAKKSNPREGLCELQGKDAVKRCQLKDGHKGKCKMNAFKNGRAS